MMRIFAQACTLGIMQLRRRRRRRNRPVASAAASVIAAYNLVE